MSLGRALLDVAEHAQDLGAVRQVERPFQPKDAGRKAVSTALAGRAQHRLGVDGRLAPLPAPVAVAGPTAGAGAGIAELLARLVRIAVLLSQELVSSGHRRSLPWQIALRPRNVDTSRATATPPARGVDGAPEQLIDQRRATTRAEHRGCDEQERRRPRLGEPSAYRRLRRRAGFGCRSASKSSGLFGARGAVRSNSSSQVSASSMPQVVTPVQPTTAAQAAKTSA